VTALPALAWVVFLSAAVLEVGGDATIRTGLRAGRLLPIVAGCAMLAAYGLVVNRMPWDFSRLLGVYVAAFALVSVLFGRFVFQEAVSLSTWAGIAIICAGGAVVQLGAR
jgi:drug/metabolite transporter superfamily protein YnfA